MTDARANRSELIQRYLDGEIEPVAPRDAATVVLLRDGEAGLETYLLRRRSSMAFGAGMHVFPGGSVDPRDRDSEVEWVGPPPSAWAAAFACGEDLARALVCAAVRETFEETGILLAGRADGSFVEASGDDWEHDRLELIAGARSLGDLLARRCLVLRVDLLRGWAHWITPEWSSRRFDTRFFVAALPPAQQTRDLGGEADHVTWIPVAAAYEAYRSGALPMMMATASTLRDVGEHPDVASVHSAHRRIRPVMIRPLATTSGVELMYDSELGSLPAASLVEPHVESCVTSRRTEEGDSAGPAACSDA